MKSVICDIRRVFTGRWLAAAIFASALSIGLSAGSRSAMEGELSLLVLPALSALPFSAEPLREMGSGAFRPALFRAGRRAYIAGKISACAVSGMAVQGLGVALWWIAARVLGQSALVEGSLALAGRMLCGGVWSLIGCAAALLTGAPGAAYLAPLCLCWGLRMIGVRFFPQLCYLDASAWPKGDPALLAALLLCAGAGAAAALIREVKRRA